MQIKTIKELYEKVQSGEIDASKLTIILSRECLTLNGSTIKLLSKKQMDIMILKNPTQELDQLK